MTRRRLILEALAASGCLAAAAAWAGYAESRLDLGPEQPVVPVRLVARQPETRPCDLIPASPTPVPASHVNLPGGAYRH